MSRPVILDFATKRIFDDSMDLSIKYDYKQSLNVVEINNKMVPLINFGEQIALQTQTKVMGEQDDNSIQYNLRMETRDIKSDMEKYFPMLLEVYTKTFTAIERDDEAINYF